MMSAPLHSSELLAQPDGIRLFAHANGWQYDATASPPALTGLWESVSNGIARDRVRGDGWECGRITGGSQSAQNVKQRGRWTVTTTVSVSTPVKSIDLGYLAIRLPRFLPHMILDATSNDRGPFSSLIRRPKQSQALSLEGDFDSHFKLYVPAGYERDALYVFAPDLMALLIDETGDLDVEVRDNQLIVYKPGGFDLTDIATWQRFERIKQVLGQKAWDQTDMYVDERVDTPSLSFGSADNTVDDAGRRLKKRTTGTIVLITLAVMAGVAFFGGITAFVLTTVLG